MLQDAHSSPVQAEPPWRGVLQDLAKLELAKHQVLLVGLAPLRTKTTRTRKDKSASNAHDSFQSIRFTNHPHEYGSHNAHNIYRGLGHHEMSPTIPVLEV